MLEERYRDKWVRIVRCENLHIGWHIQFDVSARLKVEKVKGMPKLFLPASFLIHFLSMSRFVPFYTILFLLINQSTSFIHNIPHITFRTPEISTTSTTPSSILRSVTSPDPPSSPPPLPCPDCTKCDGSGRILGGLAALPITSWWPIKAYRPCPNFKGVYKRQGQTLDEVAFGREEGYLEGEEYTGGE